jgi:hypothetical protein
LQRLFSTFPGGWPGVGLLLLRACIGITALVQGALCLFGGGAATVTTWIAGLLAITSGASLLIGFLTPVAGVLVGLGALGITLSWFRLSTESLLEAKLSTVFAVTMTAAIGCLGPGAFSIDARLFGRREIIISHTPRTKKP